MPVVFINGADPVRYGLVDSLAKPGRNATGIATLGYELDWKRMALLKEAIPSLSRLGMLLRSSSDAQERLATAMSVARSLRLELIPAFVDTPEDVDRVFGQVAISGASAVMDFDTGLALFLARERIGALAIKHRLAMYGASNIADSGVLLSYGVNLWMCSEESRHWWTVYCAANGRPTSRWSRSTYTTWWLTCAPRARSAWSYRAPC
jgi:putative ABC transport system substrate-binding protein